MFALIFTPVFAHAADTCPDLSGRFVNDRGVYLGIVQTDCTRLDVDRVEVLGGPSVHHAYVPDGRRHQVDAYVWLVKWEGDKLVLDPYSDIENGPMIGLRKTWSIDADGALREEYLNPEDGSAYDSVVYRRR